MERTRDRERSELTAPSRDDLIERARRLCFVLSVHRSPDCPSCAAASRAMSDYVDERLEAAAHLFDCNCDGDVWHQSGCSFTPFVPTKIRALKSRPVEGKP